MKLSKTAIILLKGLDTQKKERLASLLNIRMGTLYEYIRLLDDPSLTGSVTEFLKEETGLGEEKLLEGLEVEG